jgi:hypothetical protein
MSQPGGISTKIWPHFYVLGVFLDPGIMVLTDQLCDRGWTGCDKNMLLMSRPAVRHLWRYSSSIKTFVHITEEFFLSQIQGPSWFKFKIWWKIFVTSDFYNSVQTLSFWSQMSSDKCLSSCNHVKGIYEPFKVYNSSSFSFWAVRSTLMLTPYFIIQ